MPRRNKTKSGRSASDKMAVAASTAAAVYLLPAVAQAAIVHVTGSPVTLGLADVGGVATWDIDGNGTVDARLVHEQSGSHSHVFLLNEYGTAVSSTSSFSYPRALFIARSSSSSYALQALRRSNSVGTYSQTVLSSATLFTRTSSGAIQLGYGLDANFAAGDNYNDLTMLDTQVARMIACPANVLPPIKVHVREQGGFIANSIASTGMIEALQHFFGGAK